jgi:uncharacterized membrane protein
VVGRREDIEVPRQTALSQGVYAVAVAGMGLLLLLGKFVYVWVPLPRWVPAEATLARAAGALMLLAAGFLFWRKAIVTARAATVLTLLFASWLLFLQMPRIVGAPATELLWSGAAQLASVVAGGGILFATVASPTEGAGHSFRGARGVHLARMVYSALALPMFGLHHFFVGAEAAEVVPTWLPFRLGWGYGTGVAHIAAGLAILFGVVPRLAARLEAIMITAFVLFIHVPGVLGAPNDALQWTMLFVASAIGGAAWIVARSYAAPEPRTPL